MNMYWSCRIVWRGEKWNTIGKGDRNNEKVTDKRRNTELKIRVIYIRELKQDDFLTIPVQIGSTEETRRWKLGMDGREGASQGMRKKKQK